MKINNDTENKKHYAYTYYENKYVVDEYNIDRYGYEFGKYLYNLEVNLFTNYISSNGNILDIGSGTGKLFLTLKERNREVVGMDASKAMIQFIKSNYQYNNLNELYVADAQNLPFMNKSFSCVVSSRVLMHLVDWQKAIREYCRVAKDEIIIDFPPKSGVTFFIPFIHKLISPFRKVNTPYKIFSFKGNQKGI